MIALTGIPRVQDFVEQMKNNFISFPDWINTSVQIYDSTNTFSTEMIVFVVVLVIFSFIFELL